MTHTTTADEIDAAYRANNHPNDCSEASVATALDGRVIFDTDLLQKVDAVCRRCEEKNKKRRMAGVAPVDAGLADGDRVTVHATHVVDDDGLRPPHWHINSISHVTHQQPDFGGVVESGTTLVRAQATIHKSPGGAAHIVDVEVADRSPESAGPERSVVSRRQEEYVDENDATPAGTVVVDRGPHDAPASWPEVDREWLDDLVESHGPLSEPVYHMGAPDNDQPPKPPGFDNQ